MSGKKEAGEINTLVASNGSTSRISETGLHLYPVSINDSGEGLPYAPVDWPNAGDKWCWKAGKRVSVSGYIKDRYLYLPKRLRALKEGRGYTFRSRPSIEQYLRSEFPNVDINGFFASFSWMIPAKESASSKDMKQKLMSSGTKMEPSPSDSPLGTITCKAGNRICSSLTAENPLPETMFCDICCTEPGFCRDCCCILCCKTISSDYNGYSYIRCEATAVDGYICGHIAHVDCALRAYMAGTVGGSIDLDAEYFCRYCDSRTDLVSHALKLLNICTSVASSADIEKILNVGICILRGSQKRSAKQLLHRIESIMSKLIDGACVEDVFKKESSADSTGLEQICTSVHCI
ncbi:uncharacterized protein LOC107809837 isoform X1 [Nicotiana tabacum]|uniref:Uncharacterized protein LOC107809837 isoform X1 n=2 Tax=Nicotiana tabacum TaxID=4097 RepID=A0AC58RRS8_TOBAC